ncbi:MAG: hypothetical protein LC097_03335, partial [Burkholderiales bacterium]|nr:hypothetical protein [Burkholderiales bacterium]
VVATARPRIKNEGLNFCTHAKNQLENNTLLRIPGKACQLCLQLFQATDFHVHADAHTKLLVDAFIASAHGDAPHETQGRRRQRRDGQPPRTHAWGYREKQE